MGYAGVTQELPGPWISALGWEHPDWVWLKRPGFEAGRPRREEGRGFVLTLIPGFLQGGLSLSQGVVCHDLAIDGHDLIPFHNATCRGRLTCNWAVRKTGASL